MADAPRWLIPSLALGVALGSAQACISLPNPEHCANMAENPCNENQECDPCSAPGELHGCVPIGQAGVAGQCPDDGTAPTTEEATTTMMTTMGDTESTSSNTTIEPDTTATTTTGDTETTTGPPPSCDEPDGTFGETCTGNAPFCVGGECVPCSSGDPLTTCGGDLVCAPAGACVECTSEEDGACSGESPYCDPASNTCIACSEHEHCAPSACNLFTGACVEGMVVTVGAGMQHPTLAAAVTAVSAGGGGTILVANGSYDEEVEIGGAIIAFLADDGATVTWQRTQGLGAPQLRVTGGATVLMDEIDLRTNNSTVDPALRVDGASLWVDRGVIAQNNGIAIRTEASGEVVVRNCFIGGAVDLPALSNTMGSSMTIEYSTIGGALGNSNAILCDASSDVTVSDSIVLTRGGLAEVDCAMLTADHTAANTVLNGPDNVEVMATMTGWFTSYNTGDFHLTAAGQTRFQDVAQWDDGDPLVDIDGESRSGAPGTLEHAGADFIP